MSMIYRFFIIPILLFPSLSHSAARPLGCTLDSDVGNTNCYQKRDGTFYAKTCQSGSFAFGSRGFIRNNYPAADTCVPGEKTYVEYLPAAAGKAQSK